MSNWIETEDGKQVNTRNVEYFEVAREIKREENLERGVPTGRFYIRARTASIGVVVRTYDTEEEAKAELKDLVERLTGTNFQQGVTIQNPAPGAAFPGMDTQRLGKLIEEQVRRETAWARQ